MKEEKYICENGHTFNEPETFWDSTDLVRCCPIKGCTAGENWREKDSIVEVKRFPMLDGPDIDWITAEKIYVVYSGLYGTDQSLERLAERGGFGWKEVALFWSRRG